MLRRGLNDGTVLAPRGLVDLVVIERRYELLGFHVEEDQRGARHELLHVSDEGIRVVQVTSCSIRNGRGRIGFEVLDLVLLGHDGEDARLLEQSAGTDARFAEGGAGRNGRLHVADLRRARWSGT